jgi:hypothetical protein
MLERFSMEQTLRGMINECTLPSCLHKFVQTFQERFRPGTQGTLFADIQTFTQSAAVPTLSKTATSVPTDVKGTMEIWKALQPKEISRLPIPRLVGSLNTILSAGADFKPESQARGDSLVFYQTSRGIRRFAQIQSIWEVVFYPSGEQKVFHLIAIRPFCELQLKDRVHELYRCYDGAGQICYADQSELEIIETTQIVSHFTMTPGVCFKIKKAHFHALPLDRVRDLPIFVCWLIIFHRTNFNNTR